MLTRVRYLCHSLFMKDTNQSSQSPQTVNPTPVPINNSSRPKAPLLVTIVSWLMLFAGLSNSLGLLVYIYLLTSMSRFETSFETSAGIAHNGLLPDISNISYIIISVRIILGIGVVIVSFGLRNMRRWALYIFTVLTIIMVISLVYSYLISTKQNLSNNVFAGVIQVLILIYCWSISKKFVK